MCMSHPDRESISSTALKHLQVIYTQALHLYATTTLDFTDALIIAKLQQEETKIVYSFDAGFDRFPEIVRKEPGKETATIT